MPDLTIAGHPFELHTFTLDDAAATTLDNESAAIFGLFLTREAEFGVHPSVVIDYPDLSDGAETGFLADAAAYVAHRAQSMADDATAIRIVVLTTYGDRVGASFKAAGYQTIPIDMPAGPDHTAAFIRDPGGSCAVTRTLYVEAVNEQDEKIRPSFVLKLTDPSGQLRGGACGVIHERRGKRYAYLATMTLAAGMPEGSGTAMVAQLLQFLRDQRVETVHLGTQTAGRFYEKAGFKVEHRLIRNLRVRRQTDGLEVFGDLVMLSREL